MKIGKREQIVLISVGAALVIFLAHFFVFQPRSAKYAETEKTFNDGVGQISQAEVPNSPEYVKRYNEKTAQYRAEVTSLTSALKLDVPKQYLSFGESAIDQRIDDTVRLMKELIAKRSSVRVPQLSFLDDKRLPNDPYQIQQGWNIPKELPSLGVEGALWDTVVKIRDQYELMKSIKDPVERLRRRVAYNELIGRLGIKAAEVSNFYAQVPYAGVVFFNELEHYKQLTGATTGNSQYQASPVGSVQPQFNNYLSTDRFGVLVPVLKRLWISELIWAKKDPNSRMTKKELREVLEVNFPKDESLLCLNKQLEALLDMVSMAEKNGISEITRVNLLKPGGIGKALDREPGKVPTPKPSPTPGAGVYGGNPATFGEPGMMGGEPGMGGPPGMMAGPAGMMGAPMGMGMGMGMGMATPTPAVEKIGSGTGVEVWFRGTNPSTVKFLFDVTHQPRTYAVDDLHIQSAPDGVLTTSATVEMVYILSKLVM